MKIVWVSHSGGLLGAERTIVEGIIALSPLGVEIHVIVASDGLLKNKLREIGVSVDVMRTSWWVSQRGRRTPIHRGWHLYRNVVAGSRLLRLLKRVQPDLVITNTLTIPFAAFAAKAAGIPHIWYIHEFGYEDQDGLLFDFGTRRSLRLIDKLSDLIIVNSQAVRERFSAYFAPDRIRLVNLAVDVPRRAVNREENDDVFRLVLIGGFFPNKRQDDAVRALSLLARSGLTARLSLVGGSTNSYARSVRTLSEDLGVSHLVDFVPFTDDPYTYFASSDVALMCSGCEAFGRVTVEAMKFGKPVIGSSAGGTRELIRDGWNGLLYEPGNPEDLASKIRRLSTDRHLLAQMSANARAWSTSTFRLDDYGSQLMKAFQEVLSHSEIKRAS
jgi:glycosyltransferase involved in cell wall biosynthesis